MMTPRLQMNSPCTYNLDAARSVDASSHMDRSGFFGGIAQAWAGCVKRMYDEFNASFAANEGLEAVIRDLAYYDSLEAAKFIGNAFKAYRMIQENFWRTLNR